MENSYWSTKHPAVPRCFGLLAVLLVLNATALSWAEEPKASESVNSLQAVLAIQDPLVRQSEGVLLEVELRNVSEDPLRLFYAAIRPGDYYGMTMVEFMLRRTDSAQLGVCDLAADDLIVDGGGGSFKQLDPGASLKSPMMMSLQCGWGHIPPIYLEPGRYELSLLISFAPPDFAKDAWAGSVRSNWVAFEVVKAE